MQRIKVILLDDKEIPRESLAKLLDEQERIQIVSKCSNVKHAIEEVKRIEPDLVLVNDNLSECDTSEVARRINELNPKVKVALLTDSKDQKDLISAIESGATGYILKDTKVEDFVESVDLIGKGGLVISPDVAEKLGDKLSTVTPEDNQIKTNLSEREVEIIKLLAKGATNKEIAKLLVITENTTKVHIKNILIKLELRNRQQLAAYAVQSGLIDVMSDTDDTIS